MLCFCLFWNLDGCDVWSFIILSILILVAWLECRAMWKPSGNWGLFHLELLLVQLLLWLMPIILYLSLIYFIISFFIQSLETSVLKILGVIFISSSFLGGGISAPYTFSSSDFSDYCLVCTVKRFGIKNHISCCWLCEALIPFVKLSAYEIFIFISMVSVYNGNREHSLHAEASIKLY